jgi:hypothetical protein
MANKIFANGREIACKAADGKSICAFPDVCFTPPQTPATPPGVPIPYPNTAYAKDTTKGSKTVKISNKEVMLKNKSHFKKSTGNEAGRAPKKGIVTSKIQGKVYFTSWSPNVKVEGKNVVRHLDLTTHNHGSDPGNAPPWIYKDTASMQPIEACKKEVAKKNQACSGKETKEKQCNDKECRAAKKCLLVSKRQADSKVKESQVACCDGETGHHVVEAHGFTKPGTDRKEALPQFSAYNEKDAPCVCAECPQGGNGRYEGDHGILHSIQGKLEQSAIENASLGEKEYAWNYGQAKSAGVRAIQQTFPKSECSKECLKAQLDGYYKDKKLGITDKTKIRTDPPKLSDNQKEFAHFFVDDVSIKTW